jgi:hypothetical protein
MDSDLGPCHGDQTHSLIQQNCPLKHLQALNVEQMLPAGRVSGVALANF